MTYLFKLARRLAFAHAAGFVALVSLGCSDAAPREFLGPDPTTPPTLSTGPVSLHIAAAPGILAFDQTMTFVAWGRTGAGDSVAVAVNWTGTHTIRAYAVSKPSLTATTAVQVAGPGPLFQSMQISPKPVMILGGGRVAFAVTAKLQNGQHTLPSVTWSATGGSVSLTGEFIANVEPGAYQVIATTLDGTLSDTALIQVEPPALTWLQLNPRVVTIPAGETQTFEVQASWSDGSQEAPEVEWQTAGGTIIPMPEGASAAPGSNNGVGKGAAQFKAGNDVGTFKVVVNNPKSKKADTATVTITPKLERLDLTPATVQLMPGATRAFSVAGVMTDGSKVGVSVTWQATGGTISGSGVYTAGTQPGMFRVIVRTTNGKMADTSAVRIDQPVATLTSLVISPRTGPVPVNGTVTFAVQSQWSDGGTSTPPMTWSAQAGAITQDGRWTAPATAGTYRVVGRHSTGTVADTATMTVVVPPPSVTSLVVSPKTSAVQGGQALDFTAQAVLSTGSTQTTAVNWSATGGTVASTGRWTAPNVKGTYRVVGRQAAGTLADTATITVTETPIVVALVVSPGVAAANPGGTIQFSAVATWSDGQSRSTSFIWNGTGGTISPQGLFTAGSLAGQFRVIATCSGCLVADSVAVSITEPVVAPPTLTQLVLNPGTVSLTAGQAQALSIGAAWSDGSTTVPPLTWNVTGGAVSGLTYTAGASAGSYRIIVRHTGGTLADTTLVTIQEPAPPPPPPPPPPTSPPSTTIAMTARRLDGGSGTVLINHAIPLQPAMVPASYDLSRVTVRVDGTEVPLYVEVLAGAWPDGSARGLLLQYEVTLAATQTRPVLVGLGAARAAGTRTKAAYVASDGMPRAVGLPTDPDYLTRTEYHAARGVPLVPVGRLMSPSTAILQMEADYTTYSDYHAAQSYTNEWHGGATASYDRGYTAYQYWLRTGNAKFWARAVRAGHLYRVQYLDPAPGGPAVWHGQAETTEMYYRATGDSRVIERIEGSQTGDGTARGFTFKVFTGLAAHERQGTSWGGLHTPGREPRPKARAVLATVTSFRVGFTSPSVTYANDVSTQLGYLRQGMVRQGEWPRFDACGNATQQTGAVENFQVGMVATAAIEADAWLNGDTRAVEVVGQSLAHLWATSWDPAKRGFKYSPIACASAPGGGLSNNIYPELNMFYLYAAYWLAYRTNSKLWFDRAEEMMQGQSAMRSTTLMYAKQFDQSYYRFMDALAYRQAYLTR